MESSVFLSDLLTAHEPKMRKPMEINERIFWFRVRDRACGHCHHRDPRWAVAARARRRQIQGAHDQMSQQSEAAWFVHLALHVGLQHSYFLFARTHGPPIVNALNSAQAGRGMAT